MEKVTRDEVISHWTLQETLLQTYRSIFITVQSVIFSIGALISTMGSKSAPAFFALLAIGLILIHYWYSICTARAYDVSFCQMALLKIERGDESTQFMSQFKNWQQLGKDEKCKILKAFKLDKSITRRKMESDLPFFFIILWLSLAGITIYINLIQ